MSKVFSFRLSDDNPREAQAMRVIEAWAEEGYSLRYVVVEALLSDRKDEDIIDELSSLIQYLREFILSNEIQPRYNGLKKGLTPSFLDSMKQSVRLGVSLE